MERRKEKNEKHQFSIWYIRGHGWEFVQRATRQHPGMRWTDLKENLKIICLRGCKSVTRPRTCKERPRGREERCCCRRNAASLASQLEKRKKKSPVAVSQAAALCHQSCRGLFHVGQIACPDRPVDCLLLSVGGAEAVTSVRPPEGLD